MRGKKNEPPLPTLLLTETMKMSVRGIALFERVGGQLRQLAKSSVFKVRSLCRRGRRPGNCYGVSKSPRAAKMLSSRSLRQRSLPLTTRLRTRGHKGSQGVTRGNYCGEEGAARVRLRSSQTETSGRNNRIVRLRTVPHAMRELDEKAPRRLSGRRGALYL